MEPCSGVLQLAAGTDVRFWHKADMLNALTNVRFWVPSRLKAQLADASAQRREFD